MNRLVLTILCLALASCGTTQKPVPNLAISGGYVRYWTATTGEGDCDDVDIVPSIPTPRIVPVHIITDDSFSRAEIEKCIQGANQILNSPENSLGIELIPTNWTRVSFEDRSPNATLKQVWETHQNLDALKITVIKHNTLEQMVWLLGFGKVVEMVDSTYASFIILEAMDPAVLAHAVGHCFILSHRHSGEGIMRGYPFFESSETWFTENDRREVLRNKWRDLSLATVPPPSEEDEFIWSWKVPTYFMALFLGIPIVW